MDHIHSHAPSIVALVETKIKLSKIRRVNSCVSPNWPSCNNFHLSSRGRIWISWNPDVWTCDVYAISIQQITLTVQNKGKLEGYLTVVYGLNTPCERLSLWHEIASLNFQSSVDYW